RSYTPAVPHSTPPANGKRSLITSRVRRASALIAKHAAAIVIMDATAILPARDVHLRCRATTCVPDFHASIAPPVIDTPCPRVITSGYLPPFSALTLPIIFRHLLF